MRRLGWALLSASKTTVGALALLLLSAKADAASFSFSTGDPDGKIATLSRPSSPGRIQTESADDFVLTQSVVISQATFTGLLPLGTPLGSVRNVEIEIYHVFPGDSNTNRTPTVPTRGNSPGDVEIEGATRDGRNGSLRFAATLVNASFTAANSVLNGIHPSPGEFTTGEGAVTGEEVGITVGFNPPIALPAGHYFFRPEVESSSGDFLWLSAPRPIVAPGTPFLPDLQSWIRNDQLAPDWLRIGTDITHQGPFNAAFSLSGETDEDGDGVGDSLDLCPGTPGSTIVDATGCSIAQLAPCSGPAAGGTWKNHGQYVSAVTHVAEAFRAQGLISAEQAHQIVEHAAQSECGTPSQFYRQVNLVSDQALVAIVRDTNLVNPWGMSFSPTSTFWVNDSGTGRATLYAVTNDSTDLPHVIKQSLEVSIPGVGPTGQAFNNTTHFHTNAFLFVSKDGIISGWRGALGTAAEILAVRPGAAYTGVTLASVGGVPFLLAANFAQRTVDVYDGNLALLGQLSDPYAPAGYAPFNVQTVGDTIFVMFARQDADLTDEVTGRGRGLIDVLDLPTQTFHRFVTGSDAGGHLREIDAPWGVAVAPDTFGKHAGQILVGNFGSGTIMTFDDEGRFKGFLEDSSHRPVVNEGLWTLTFGNGTRAGVPGTLYFTAGIDDERHGLVGSLEPATRDEKSKDNRTPEVPQDIAVRPGNKVVFHGLGIGVQAYTWNGASWGTATPEATLFDEDGNVAVIHFTGPSWESNNGSKVVGAVVPPTVTVDTNAIPWLLLSAVRTEGNGILSDVTFIQRIHTTGGKAPAADGTVVGQVARVPYTADYFFYRKQ
jgi:uncharacterized protein (TIGR03118 family)